VRAIRKWKELERDGRSSWFRIQGNGLLRRADAQEPSRRSTRSTPAPEFSRRFDDDTIVAGPDLTAGQVDGWTLATCA